MNQASRGASGPFGRALAAADRLSLWAVWVGGALLFAAAFTVAVDVTLRKLWKLSVGGADELSGYAFAIGIAWAFPHAVLRRANVRIDVLYRKLPRLPAALLDVLALAAIALMAAVLARYAFQVLSSSWDLGSLSNSQLKVPLWIPQGLWFLGLALFFVTVALLTARAAAALLSGDAASVIALAGARSIEEEASEEAAYGRSVAAEREGRPP